MFLYVTAVDEYVSKEDKNEFPEKFSEDVIYESLKGC